MIIVFLLLFQSGFAALSVDKIETDIKESLIEAQKLLEQEILEEAKDQNEVVTLKFKLVSLLVCTIRL